MRRALIVLACHAASGNTGDVDPLGIRHDRWAPDRTHATYSDIHSCGMQCDRPDHGSLNFIAYAHVASGLNLCKGGSFQSEHMLQQGAEAFSMPQSPNEQPSIFTRTEITPWSGKQTNFLFDVST